MTMDLGSLTKEELDRNLRELTHASAESSPRIDELQQSVQELQVHRIELEMQNRALREMQCELEQAVHRYSDLYDNLPLPYVTVTPAGQIVSANRAATEWLKSGKRGLTGAYMGRLLDAYDAGRLAAHLEACIVSGVPLTTELTLRPSGETPVAVQLSSRVAQSGNGREARIHVAIIDVSQAKHAQRVLEDVNRQQEEFNHSISHDLRAPLVTIDNYARIVLAEHAAGLDDEGRRMIGRMQAAAQRMEETLRQLLTYSTLAREEVEMVPLDLEAIVRDLLQQHRLAIEQQQARIDVQKPLPSVRASGPLLMHVLRNLLSNALKYAKPDQPPHVTISADARDRVVLVRVCDRGIGIEPRYHERIFRVFERLHGYSQFPGSGVGLAIARRAMERMNGRIWVESEAGQGSTFWLELLSAP